VCSILDRVEVIFASGMTVIAAYINRDGEAVVVSDSCVSNVEATAALRHDAVKTIRLNSDWALALSGHNRGSAALGAMLYDNSAIKQDAFTEIERRGLERTDLVGDRAREVLSEMFLDDRAPFMELAQDCHVLLAGVVDRVPELWHWPSVEKGWVSPDKYEITAGDSKLVIVAPNLMWWQADVGVSVVEAMGRILTYCSERFPNLVDTKLAIRKHSSGFALEYPAGTEIS